VVVASPERHWRRGVVHVDAAECWCSAASGIRRTMETQCRLAARLIRAMLRRSTAATHSSCCRRNDPPSRRRPAQATSGRLSAPLFYSRQLGGFLAGTSTDSKTGVDAPPNRPISDSIDFLRLQGGESIRAQAQPLKAAAFPCQPRPRRQHAQKST
jgi:hypothetical protein